MSPVLRVLVMTSPMLQSLSKRSSSLAQAPKVWNELFELFIYACVYIKNLLININYNYLEVSAHFILKALEDEVALGILEFLDPFFLFQFVVLHGATHVIALVLRVEHVSAKVQYRLLVDLAIITLYVWMFRI